MANQGTLYSETLAGGTNSSTSTVWYNWNSLFDSTYSTAGNAITSTNTATNTWYHWCDQTTATATASCDPNVVWLRWNDNWGYHHVDKVYVPQETEEQKQQRAAQLEQAKLAAEARAQEIKEATDRATALLEAHLDPEQLSDYSKTKSFTVVSRKSGRRYRIDYGIARNVRLLREDGAIEKNYCAHLYGGEPAEDHMLAQKLYLEHDEDAFLRVANPS